MTAGLILFLVALQPVSAQANRWVLGVQPVVSAESYRSREAFEARLSQAVDRALGDPRLRPSDEKLVVLPEHVGTWLAVSGEADGVYKAKDRAHAIGRLLLGDAGFAKALLASAVRERRWDFLDSRFVFKTLLRLKAPQMWEDYRETCSNLARTRKITLVCGSIALPSPSGPIQNSAFTFGPDGKLLNVAGKVHPVKDELGFLSAAPLEALKVASTPFGRIGVMVCADGWHSDVYGKLKGAEVLAQPSFGEGGLPAFQEPWKGYDSGATPSEARGLIGKISERQAWRRFSLAGRIAQAGARFGVNPFLAGSLWDMRTGGYGVAIQAGRVIEVATDAARDTWMAFRLP